MHDKNKIISKIEELLTLIEDDQIEYKEQATKIFIDNSEIYDYDNHLVRFWKEDTAEKIIEEWYKISEEDAYRAKVLGVLHHFSRKLAK